MPIQTQEIIYQSNNSDFQGFIAFDDTNSEPKPGVIIVHEWWGHNDFVRSKAEQLAADGYIGFALDMYGVGKTATDPEQAGIYMNEARETPGAIVERFDAAMDTLKSQSQVDSSVIYACGFCFGGAVVLEMARAGRDLNAVASFHGLLETENPMKAGIFDGEIGVYNGADDPMVSAEILQVFENEMSEAGVTCSLVNYPGVVHGFTNPEATARGEKYGMPLAYNQAAAEDSYNNMIELFATSQS